MMSTWVKPLARAAFALALLAGAPVFAQTPPPSPPVAASSPTPLAETPSPTSTPTPDASGTPLPNPDLNAAAGSVAMLAARPAAYLDAKASRDEVFDAIMASLATISGEIAKANLKAAGRPLALFLEADDEGFKYRAEIPIEAAPEGKTQLSDQVKIGVTPVGKAMRFEHRGAYDDIDATYEAITAYLDEKGIEAQDVFLEEYLNDVKTGDDPNLQVDIYVLLK